MRCVLRAAVAKLLTKKAADSTQKTAVRLAAASVIPGAGAAGPLPACRMDGARRGCAGATRHASGS